MRVIRIAMAAAVVLALAGCGGRTPEQIALQPQEAQGLVRCPSTGTLAHYSDSAWRTAKADDATSGWIAVYAPRYRCQDLSQPDRGQVEGTVIEFGSQRQAADYWSSGLSAADRGSAMNVVTGAGTGLGQDSEAATIVVANGGSYGEVWWAHGSDYGSLIAPDEQTAEALARIVDERM